MRASERDRVADDAVGQVVLGILSFVRWPAEPAELQLCVIGDTQYAGSLMGGLEQGNGRAVRVRRHAAATAGLGGLCDVLYLGGLSDDELQALLGGFGERPFLSISEADPGCSVGNMFCLHVAGTQVTFSVNLDSLARSGVRVHPNVLKLARSRAGA